jgi:hypothetical protein
MLDIALSESGQFPDVLVKLLVDQLWTHFVAFSGHINIDMVHLMLNDMTLLFKACLNAN